MNRSALAILAAAVVAATAGPGPATAQETSPAQVTTVVGVTARVGEHADYSRVTFDVPANASYVAARNGDVVTITFDTPGTLAVLPISGPAYGRVTAITQTSAPGRPLVVAVGVSPNASLRHFMLDNKLVLQVIDDTVTPPPEAAEAPVEAEEAAETSAPARIGTPPIPLPRPDVIPPRPAPEMETAATADAPPPESAASEVGEADVAESGSAEAAEAAEAEDPEPDTAAAAPVAAPVETGGLETADAAAPAMPTVTRPAALDSAPEATATAQFDIAAAQAEMLGSPRGATRLVAGAPSAADGAASAPGIAGLGDVDPLAALLEATGETEIAFVGTAAPFPEVAIDPAEERYRSGRATFDLLLPTGLAAFERAGALYLIFAARGPIDAGVLLRQGRDSFPGLQEIPAEGGVVLRLPIDDGTYPTVGRFTTAWTISLAQRAPRDAATALEPRVEIDAGGMPEIVLPRDGTARVVRFTDPVVGDRIVAVPVAQLGAAVNEGRSYVQFDLLDTFQGIVIAPKTDSLSVRISDEGVRIDDTGGLMVSLPS